MAKAPSLEDFERGSWLQVAEIMGREPEMAVLRRFRKLNILRLLEMQSNLTQEEKDFETIWSLDAADADCPISRSYKLDWASLDESKGNGGSKLRDAWRKLRDGLEAYSNSTQ